MGRLERPVYIDANILIYAMETDGDDGMLARRWLMQIDRGLLVGVTSEITIVEVLPHPLAEGNRKLVDGYRRLLTSIPGLRVVPISSPILFRAAELRASQKSDTPDAIHAATAVHAGCGGFLTNDTRLRFPSELIPYKLQDVTGLFYR